MDIAEVKKRVDLVAFLAAEMGPPTKAGRSYKWRCPFADHGDENPSFVVTPSRDGEHFYCFGCHRSGDVLDYLTEVRGLDFGAARAMLPELAEKHPRSVEGAAPAVKSNADSATQTAALKEWRAVAGDLIAYAERNLDAQTSAIPGYTTAREYLTGPERCLSAAAIKAAWLGFNPAWHTVEISGQGARVPPGVIIPWVISGAIYAVKIRKFDGDKYAQLPYLGPGALPRTVYPSYNLLTRSAAVVIVEGEFDALLGNDRAGDVAAFITTGSAGANARSFADGFKGKAVKIIPDRGDAGERAVETWREALGAVGVDLAVINLPVGDDLTEYAAQGGDVRALIEPS